jgi:uncharacterized membrane protein
MTKQGEKTDLKQQRIVKMTRLEALGDAVFAFALTLLALDLRLPEIVTTALAQGLLALLPKLLIFVFAFLVIAQEWDVHQRTLMLIIRADGVFVWLYLLSLMFVVLMPASADILGRYPLQPLALVIFGANIAFLSLASGIMWHYASHTGQLLDDNIEPFVIKLISRLWQYPPLIIALTIPLGFVNVYSVYIIWILMPFISYSYSNWVFRKKRKYLK